MHVGTHSYLAAGLTYFLTTVQQNVDSTLISAYLRTHPSCEHVVAPLHWERDKRTHDVVREGGRERGREEGREGGRKEGREEGREEGRKEGREGGRKQCFNSLTNATKVMSFHGTEVVM